MADLDIQIDVPDDDGLESPVRVLNGSRIPPWLTVAVLLGVGAIGILSVGAYLLGRTGGSATDDELDPAPASLTTALESAPDSPAIERSLEAVSGWEDFTRTGDVSAIASTFDPNGPQYQLFEAAAGRETTDDLDFSARNLSESTDGLVTTVSMDLVVTSDEGDEVYPYDFVYLDGNDRVWTVVDRRSSGAAAIPPAQEMIDGARQSWELFASSVAVEDGAGVLAVVGPETVELAGQLITAAEGGEVPASERVIADAELFDVLVERVRAAAPDDEGGALLALLDLDQRRSLVDGELASWTQTDPDKIIASLVVGGEPVALVPFVASAEGWAFDLVGAVSMSGGTV